MDILLIDDHPLFRKALHGVLRELVHAPCIQEAASVAEAMVIINGNTELGLVLYDWRLPDGGGLRGLVAVCQLLPMTPVVVVSANEDPGVITAALAVGARGFIPKSTSASIIQSALNLVLAGETYVPVCALNATHAPPPHAQAGVLTSRQEEVLSLLAEGHANKRIARMLGIAETTVRVHVSDILRELQADNRTEAVARARRLGLLAIPYSA